MGVIWISAVTAGLISGVKRGFPDPQVCTFYLFNISLLCQRQ